MAKSRSLTLLAALVLGGACAWPSPERQLLLDFFQACRVYDRTQLAKLATASCNPKTDGVVQDFDIVSIERREAAWPVREVTITAHVRPLDGEVTERRLVVTLEQMDRRWMVTAWTRPGRGPSAEERPPRIHSAIEPNLRQRCESPALSGAAAKQQRGIWDEQDHQQGGRRQRPI
jgi:hypothetical protein